MFLKISGLSFLLISQIGFAQVKSEPQPAHFQINVTLDHNGQLIKPLISTDADWSKIVDPLWSVSSSLEKSKLERESKLEIQLEDVKINSMFHTYQSHNPHSCESVYYGLFTDGKNAVKTFPFEGENLADDSAFTQKTFNSNLEVVDGFWTIRTDEKSKFLKDFNALKRIFPSTYLAEREISENPLLMAEITKRARTAHLVIAAESPGAFGNAVTDCRDEHLSCNKRQMLAVNTQNNGIYNSPMESREDVTFGVRQLLKIKSEPARIWLAAHELVHGSDVFSPVLSLCLEKTMDLKKTLKSKLPFIVDYLRKSSGSGYYYGRGTEYTNIMRSLIVEDFTREIIIRNIKPNESTYKSVESQVRVTSSHQQVDTRNADTHPFIEQYSEAMADTRATIATVHAIYAKYPGDPEARRQAALSILFSLKPSMYTGNQAKLMDIVGSKKLNETRVLKGILANLEFRKLLGCEFENPQSAPRDCSDPSVLSTFKTSASTSYATSSQKLPFTKFWSH
jgi:hypothetical protein